MDDLWPDDLMDSLDKVKTPISILREQASLLGTKTGNLIEGKVYTASWEDQKDYPFQYGFYLEAPTLENYRFTMFYLFYDIELYPLIMFLDEDIFGEIDVQGLA
jgi:hypothetical protein